MIRICLAAGAALLMASAAACAAPASGDAPSLLPGETYRYVADLSGGQVGRVVLSIAARPDHTLSGRAEALAPDGAMLASGPVSGRIAGQDCRMRIAFAAPADPAHRHPPTATDVMDGTCGPEQLQGTVRVIRAEHGVRGFFDWWGAGEGTGQFWLVRAAG